MIKSGRLENLIPFNPNQVLKSLLESLIKSGLVTHYFLSAQWRMHPSISYITSVPFYKCYFENHLPVDRFFQQYNQPEQDERAFTPMSFIDTSSLSNREEQTRGQGKYFNDVEAIIVSDVINRLYAMVGTRLNDRIAVIASYKAQVSHITRTINHFVPELGTEQERRRRGVLVCTVDSMQGCQRDVVIFSTTRSNQYGNVGFVDDAKRLNVSVTRARYLNVIIGDSSTMKFKDKGIPELAQIFNQCSRHKHGSRVYKPTKARRNSGYNYNFTALGTASDIETRSTIININEAEPQLEEATPDFDFSTLFTNE